MTDNIHYYVSEDPKISSSTTVGHTNTRILQYISNTLGFNSGATSLVYIAEVNLRNVMNYHAKQIQLLVDRSSLAEDRTEYCTKASYPEWDGRSPIMEIDAADIRGNLEASIGSVLFHLVVLMNHLEHLAFNFHLATRNSGYDVIFPGLNQIVIPDNGIIDNKTLCKIRKSLGKEFLRDKVSAQDQEYVGRALVRLKKWRDKRTHNLMYFVDLKDGLGDLHYNSHFNILRDGQGEIYFTHKELVESVNQLFSLLQWFCEKSNNYIEGKRVA